MREYSSFDPSESKEPRRETPRLVSAETLREIFEENHELMKKMMNYVAIGMGIPIGLGIGMRVENEVIAGDFLSPQQKIANVQKAMEGSGVAAIREGKDMDAISPERREIAARVIEGFRVENAFNDISRMSGISVTDLLSENYLVATSGYTSRYIERLPDEDRARIIGGYSLAVFEKNLGGEMAPLDDGDHVYLNLESVGHVADNGFLNVTRQSDQTYRGMMQSILSHEFVHTFLTRDRHPWFSSEADTIAYEGLTEYFGRRIEEHQYASGSESVNVGYLGGGSQAGALIVSALGERLVAGAYFSNRPEIIRDAFDAKFGKDAWKNAMQFGLSPEDNHEIDVLYGLLQATGADPKIVDGANRLLSSDTTIVPLRDGEKLNGVILSSTRVAGYFTTGFVVQPKPTGDGFLCVRFDGNVAAGMRTAEIIENDASFVAWNPGLSYDATRSVVNVPVVDIQKATREIARSI